MAELYVRQKIDVGLEQLDSGQSLSQEEVEERLSDLIPATELTTKARSAQRGEAATERV